MENGNKNIDFIKKEIEVIVKVNDLCQELKNYDQEIV